MCTEKCALQRAVKWRLRAISPIVQVRISNNKQIKQCLSINKWGIIRIHDPEETSFKSFSAGLKITEAFQGGH